MGRKALYPNLHPENTSPFPCVVRERITVYTISVRQAGTVLSNDVLRMRVVTHQSRLPSHDLAIISTSTSCCNLNSFFCLQDVCMPFSRFLDYAPIISLICLFIGWSIQWLMYITGKHNTLFISSLNSGTYIVLILTLLFHSWMVIPAV